LLVLVISAILPVKAQEESLNPESVGEKVEQMDRLLNFNKQLFRENVGQWDDDLQYRSVSSNSSISFKDDCISFGLRRTPDFRFEDMATDVNKETRETRSEFLVWQLKFTNSNPDVHIEAGKAVESRVNYFGPGQTQGKTIPAYEAIRYVNLYDGVDLSFYNTNEGALKYDLILAPGTDLSQVEFRYDGVEGAEIAADGKLLIETAWGTFSEAKPYSYQIIDGEQVEVDIRYEVQGNSLRYELYGNYDPSLELVIDPMYVDWSTYFYGTGQTRNGYNFAYTWVEDLDMDENFDVYITGRTSDYFPTDAGSYDTSINGHFDAFVCKMNKDGDSLIYFSYIGGSGYEFPSGIAVNSQKQPVMSGMTWSSDFPITSNAYDKNGAGLRNYKSFVTKFNDSGTKLIFSTFLGGSGWFNSIKGITLNSKGEVYLAGATSSSDFPTTPGCIQDDYKGGGGSWGWLERDAFFTILKSDGSDLVYSTYIGGAGNETALNIALNHNEEIYLVGKTSSNNFPVTLGSRQFFNYVAQGPEDGFVMKLSKDAKKILYSNLMGGSGTDVFEGIYVNKYDEAYVAGYSNSSNFPTKSAYQSSLKGGYDQVVVKLISSGTNVKYSTFVGGTGDDYFYQGWWYYSYPNIRIAANIREEAIICGISKSTDYPVTSDALQKINKSTWGASTSWRPSSTIAKLSINGDKLLYGTYWGGSSYEYPGAVKLKRVSCYTSILYGGMTASEDYPTTPGVYRDSIRKNSAYRFYWNGFVSRFRDTLYTDEIQLALQDTVIECDKVYVIADAKNQGADIKWSHGPDERFVILEDTGTYWVYATYGCDTTRDTITVKLEHIPKVPVFGNDTIFCDKFTPRTLDAKNDTIRRAYRWHDGDTNQTYYADKPGKYWVDVITPNCGTKTDTITFTLKQSPDIQLLGDTTLCDSAVFTLDAGYISDDMVYRWNTDDSVQSIGIRDTGTYWVTMENHCGKDSASTHISLRATPTVDLPADSIFCDDVDITLTVGDATNDETYLWTDWARTVSYGIGNSIQRLNDDDVRIKIENHCGIAEDSMRLSIIGTPVYGTWDTIYACDQVDELLAVKDPQTYYSYSWTDRSAQSTYQVNSPGYYRVLISNKCGTDSMSWTVMDKYTPVLSLPNDSSYCNSIATVLNADINDDEATYLWQDGSSASTYNLNAAGLYRVLIANRCGSIEDSVRFKVISNPDVDLADERVFCGAVTPVTLQVGMIDNEEAYLWTSGSTMNEETFDSEGVHGIVITNKCGSAEDSIRFRVSHYPVVDLGMDTILCGNFALTLDAGNPGATYIWEPTGEVSQKIIAKEQTIYSVRVINEDGCESSDDFEIGSDCISTYYVPSAFSPNGDNLNDLFLPELVNYEDYEMLIMNRWGEIIFRTNNALEGWDGNYLGKEAPPGVYVYSMRFVTTENGEYVTVSGALNLLR